MDLVHCIFFFDFARSFRTIGDEIFMQAFESTSMPFELWTHEAHLRMAWNYITQHGQQDATPLIKQGILRLNEKNKDKIKYGYSETITMFYIHVLTKAILSMPSEHTFEDFLKCHKYLTDSSFIAQYYSSKVLENPESKVRFFEPDRAALT